VKNTHISMVLTIAVLIPLNASISRAAPDEGPRVSDARIALHVPTSGVQPENLKTKLDKIVESYRKIIVLLDDESTLDDALRARCVEAGRNIYREKQLLLDELSRTLPVELRKAVASRFRERPVGVDAFIDYVTRNPALRDADRLAFIDLADELLAVVREEEQAARLKKSDVHTALERINAEIKSIQGAYQKEISRIFSRLQARGKPAKRQKWQEYVAFLRGLLNRDQILKEYGDQKPEDREDMLRGSRRDTKTEIFGYDLPEKSVVLTFDDGPHRRYTDEILAILKKYGVRAAFFSVGQNLGEVDDKNNVKLAPTAAVARRVLDSGNLLANHSYSHPILTRLAAGQRAKEIDKTNLLLETIIGSKPRLFRPPYGAKDSALIKMIEADGMRSVLWNLDSLDWADPIAESIAQRVLGQIGKTKKGILLLHDIHKQSVAALALILDQLTRERYDFLTYAGDELVAAGSRAPKPPNAASAGVVRASDNDKQSYYRESWAVIIGINDYQTWPKLRYCVNDANSVEETLVSRFGFKRSNIIKLLNKDATRERIVWALGDQMADTNKVRKDDRVFVFFAGHGATRQLPSGKELGYIVPADADAEASQARSISMNQLQEFCELIPAKHLYFVIDSCYSGLALTRSGASRARNRNYLEEITRRAARQILTAGGADQQVADNGPGGHSIFTWTLLQGLQGVADADGNGAITASELGGYIGPIVSSLSQQTPAFGNLAGSEGGEFVFELQQESLSETSKQLDEEAIKLSEELDRIQKEITAKRERNSKLRAQVEQERAKLAGEAARTDKPQTRAAEAQTHHSLGLKLYREKKYDEAAGELDLAAKLDPANATIVNNLGFTLYKLGKFWDSIGKFQKAIEIDPQRAIAYLNLADAYVRVGKPKDATRNYEKYLELAPSAANVDQVRQRIAELQDKQ